MKLLISFLTIALLAFACANDEQQQPKIVLAEVSSDDVSHFSFWQYLDDVKTEIQCEEGSAPTSSLNRLRWELIKLRWETCLSSVVINIRCTELAGLDEIIVNSISFNPIQLLIPFSITIPRLQFQSSYDHKANLIRLFHLEGNGGLEIALKSLSIDGHVRLGLRSGGLYVRDLSVSFGLGESRCKFDGLSQNELTNGFVSVVCEWAIKNGVNDMPTPLEEFINAALTNLLNELLQNMTVADIMELINQIANQNRMITKGFQPITCNKKSKKCKWYDHSDVDNHVPDNSD